MFNHALASTSTNCQNVDEWC
jgi:ERO1-like protein alpha